MGWYNFTTRKDHFPLPFVDQIVECLTGQSFYYFLDGFLGYLHIPIDYEEHKKTTFTCPFRTFAYRCMPFGLCNAPVTFQRCMMSIFSDMAGQFLEVFLWMTSWSTIMLLINASNNFLLWKSMLLNAFKMSTLCQIGVFKCQLLTHQKHYLHIKNCSRVINISYTIRNKPIMFLVYQESSVTFLTEQKIKF